MLYDHLLEKDGRELLLVPVLNYSQLSCEPIREMLLHPRAALGLGDGGAHCGIICDASIPTFMLTHWARDRTRGAKLPLELVVRRMTRDTAELYGFADRGTVEVGQKADLNVIDFAGAAPRAAAHGARSARGRRALPAARARLRSDDRLGRGRRASATSRPARYRAGWSAPASCHRPRAARTLGGALGAIATTSSWLR